MIDTVALLDSDKLTQIHALSRAQVDVLWDRQLIDIRGRRLITHVVPRAGVAIATIRAALRLGIRDRLPAAECQQTVVRIHVDGAGPYYAPHRRHLASWGAHLERGIAE